MKLQLQERLNRLREEQAAGQEMLADLERRQAELHQTLLRISGAIQVLEELLTDAPSDAGENDVKRFSQPMPGSNGHK